MHYSKLFDWNEQNQECLLKELWICDLKFKRSLVLYKDTIFMCLISEFYYDPKEIFKSVDRNSDYVAGVSCICVSC